ncbi:MAG TPA: HEAT repeat domain-containing protein [Thermoanaerobaculia bacterium]|nr:HEAT repeat domain-containing protein [Thermoanaerobaculia bacterium]
MKLKLPCSALLLCLAAPALAMDAPQVANAKIETASAAAGLEAAVRQAEGRGREPFWAAWTVPMVAGQRYNCCWSHNGDFKNIKTTACHLEGKNQSWGSTDDVKVPPDQDLLVLVRLQDRKIGRILAFSAACPLDADGRRFVWLGAAKPEESVALLAKTAESGSKVSEEALSALSYHRNARADDVLEAMASAPKPQKLREDALFWLGQNRGERGARFLGRIIGGATGADPDGEIRKKAIFSLSQSKASGAGDAIIQASREDQSGDVRGEALFWLAQMNDPRAPEAILHAIEKEREMEVRKKGVFALSQLSGGRGVPLLVRLGQESQSREVRKEALFWLAQSDDPAALKYLDKVLNE